MTHIHSFVPQRFDWVKTRGFERRQQARHQTDDLEDQSGSNHGKPGDLQVNIARAAIVFKKWAEQWQGLDTACHGPPERDSNETAERYDGHRLEEKLHQDGS